MSLFQCLKLWKLGRRESDIVFASTKREEELASQSFHLQEEKRGKDMGMSIKQRGTLLLVWFRKQEEFRVSEFLEHFLLCYQPHMPPTSGRPKRTRKIFFQTESILIKCSCHFCRSHLWVWLKEIELSLMKMVWEDEQYLSKPSVKKFLKHLKARFQGLWKL